MNKKTKLQNELNESIKREPSREDCPDPSCKQHFGNSTILREAHQNRYPDHFKAVEAKQPEKVEAIQVDLKPKIKRSTKKEGT